MMATKKSIPKKKAVDKTLLEKIGDQAVHLKEEIIEGKDHLVELTELAVASLKAKIHDMTAPAKTTIKKASKSAVKKAAKKTIIIKKAVPAKTSPKKVAKKRLK